jgi:hypothetical protein
MENTGNETMMTKRLKYITIPLFPLLIILWTGSVIAGQTTEPCSPYSESKTFADKGGVQYTHSVFTSHTMDNVHFRNDIQKVNNFYNVDFLRLANRNEYEETQIRRFETVFFISLPVSFLLSFLSTILYREFAGKTEYFTEQEYGYIILSSIGISMSIAIRDNRIVFHQNVRQLREGY